MKSCAFGRWLSVALSLLVLAAPAYAAISGSDHDFSGQGWSGGKICGVCHTPHNADTSVAGAPLWNHEVTTATYTLYSSPTLDATVSQPEHYASKLCLSCHDGTVALDSFGGNMGSTFIDGDHNVGTDLSGMHPIGIVYDATLATTDGGLFNPLTTTTALGDSINDDQLFGAGNLECASCHDVHNSNGNEGLLRVNNDASALCLTCHDK